MRIVVDFDLCESNAVCMGIAPEIFEVRDDDFLYVLDENPPESMRAKMEESVQRCPKQAGSRGVSAAHPGQAAVAEGNSRFPRVSGLGR